MTSEEVVSQFIGECARQGITKPDGIKQVALTKIKEIDQVLAEADKLRRDRSNMVSVIRAFGFEMPKASKRVVSTLSEDTTEDQLDPISLNYAIQICNFLEKHSEASPRELMGEFGVTSDKDYEIYSVIKWLCNIGVCARTKTGELIRGPKWEDRPKGEKNESN